MFRCFLGSGLGYHINRLLESADPGKGSAGLLLERDVRVFSACLYVLKPRVLSVLVPFVGEDSLSGAQQYLAREPRVSEISIVSHPGSRRLHPGFYTRAELLLKRRRAESAASSLTQRAAGGVWERNVVKNLRRLDRRCFSSLPLKGLFNGPAILAASGPFLEEAAPLLRAQAGRLPVLALLPSVPFLLENGIRPLMAVTTDPGYWNRLHLVRGADLQGAGLRGADLPLVTTFSVDTVLFREWPSEKYLFSHGLSLERRLASVADSTLEIPMQGTASIVMILLARMLGFSRLYLAGFDFAFNGLQDHHRGAGFQGYLYAITNRLRPRPTQSADRMRNAVSVRGSDGGRLTTSPALMLYRNWLESETGCDDLVRLNRGASIQGLAGGTIPALPCAPDHGSRCLELLAGARVPLSSGRILEELEAFSAGQGAG
jgi:hypothetical protein